MHEMTDADARLPKNVAIASTVMGVALMGLMAWMFFGLREHFSGEKPPVSALIMDRKAPPPPNLQISPQEDLDKFRERNTTVLNSYGWVDRKAGIVRIPIEKAMELYANEK